MGVTLGPPRLEEGVKVLDHIHSQQQVGRLRRGELGVGRTMRL